MAKNKIAFIVTGYGKEVNGGTEQHCRMLAERLVDEYEVEVLTTCVKDYSKGENELPEGVVLMNGVCVRRFKVAPELPELHACFIRKSKWIRRLRKWLYQVGLLRFCASIHPVWTSMQEWEDKVMKSYVFYSPDLLAYVEQHKDEYKAFIPINISYPLAYYVAISVPEKTLLIPTMHHESSTFRAIYSKVFTRVAYIGFNTGAEQSLAEHIFSRKRMSAHGIISVGIEQSVDADWKEVKEKYQLPEEYLLYVGRVDAGKLHHIIQYYLSYKKKYPASALKLVLVGGLFSQPVVHPDIIYTGFVTDAEKYAIIQHAKVLVNPSKFESLSLILLEGMSRGKPMLVNGNCAVLKEHCVNSQGAVQYYTGKRSFIDALHRMENSEEWRKSIASKSVSYVRENYDWSIIMPRLKRAIEVIG